MKYPVKKRFKSLEGISYRVGSVFETSDTARAKKLQKRELIGEAIGREQGEEPIEELIETPQEERKIEELTIVMQKPGGWYELSDGRTVRRSELPEELQ
jgi:hypothetical protein